MCGQWANCITYGSLPRDYGGHVIPKGSVIRPFNYAQSNGYLKNNGRMSLGKRGVRGGLVALQSFGHLRIVKEFFAFR